MRDRLDETRGRDLGDVSSRGPRLRGPRRRGGPALAAAVAGLLAVGAWLALAGGAHGQLPPPQQPEPNLGGHPRCTPEYRETLKTQAEAVEKLRTSGPEAVGRICSLIEMGSAWLGGKLPDDLRRELQSQLGVDIDLERIRTQCRAGQDSLERELITKLAQLRAELLRCDDTI